MAGPSSPMNWCNQVFMALQLGVKVHSHSLGTNSNMEDHSFLGEILYGRGGRETVIVCFIRQA